MEIGSNYIYEPRKKNLLSKRENGLVWLGRKKLNMKKKKKRQPLNQRPFLKEDRRNEKEKMVKMCACACC
jgi:hypothetical protein